MALIPGAAVLAFGVSPYLTSLALLCFSIYMPFLAAMSFLSDPNEIYRHSLQVSVGLRLLRIFVALGWVTIICQHAGTARRLR